MKANREHRVPLSPRAVLIIEKLAKFRTGDFAFPGRRLDKPLSNMAGGRDHERARLGLPKLLTWFCVPTISGTWSLP
jgi:integrase